ncbi:MAG: preprotein translocase subunit SecE [Lachnospiraceae bacterium]|nr:preprotein translocase subunit SecE [Lachnospiraceae bacterium]
MGETENKTNAPKESWFEGVKAEFGKIIWPTKESLARQTTAVVVVSVIVGLIITLLDSGIQQLVNILVNL